MSNLRNLDKNKLLGQGGFGKVFEAVWCAKPVAIKRIPLSDITSNEREEEALKKLDHPNIIKLLHVESDSKFRYYYLELCNASLDKLFLKYGDPKKYNGPMPPIFDVLYQLAVGLEYIHKSGLIHRDIKPANVLIWVSPENGKVLMKWADFGLSKPVNERGTCSMSEVSGTPNWLAPELLKLLLDDGETEGDKIEQRGTIQTDVFAEGLVFGCYLTDGLHLYGSRFQINANILTNKPVNLLRIQPQNVRDLIQKMLADKPEKRITSSDVVHQLEQIRNPVDQMKLFALLKAQTNPSEEEIKTLIDEGFDLNCVDEKGMTPLLYLIEKKGNDKSLLKLLQFLIKNGIDVNCKDKYGYNALTLLCEYYKKENLIEIIRLLTEKGTDVNCKNDGGKNALHLLCFYYKNENLIDIIRLLIEKGIDVNCKSISGINTLHLLCRYYKNDNLIGIIQLLIENGIDVNCKDDYGYNALFHLCQKYENKNLIDIIRLLIEKGIDVNCKNEDGWNALHYLCENYKNENLIDIIRLLIEKGIDVNYKDIVVLRQNYRIENCSQIVDLLKQHTSYCDLVRYYCSQIGLALVCCFTSCCELGRCCCQAKICCNNVGRYCFSQQTLLAKICITTCIAIFLVCCIVLPLTATNTTTTTVPPATTTVPTATPDDPFVNNDSFINKAFYG